jgi:thiol:disulfide interchange protein DsbD
MATGSIFMVAYGLGMGIPFLVLGTYSSALARLPRSGAWMNAVKFMFALTMMGASAYFTVLGFNAYNAAAPSTDLVAKLDQDLANYRLEGMPVVIDFYANWCKSCKDIEQITFKDPRVEAKMKEFKLIRIDLSVWSDEVGAKFGIVGLPLIIFYDALGIPADDQRVTGFIAADAFLQLLNNVQKRSPG